MNGNSPSTQQPSTNTARVTDARIRIGEDRAIAMPERRQLGSAADASVAPPRKPAATATDATITRIPSTASTPRQPRKSPIRPESEAPKQVAGHRARQRAADRDLALFRSHQIAGQPERHRKHAAGADAGKNAASRTTAETRSTCAPRMLASPAAPGTRSSAAPCRTDRRPPQHRLDDREGEGEHRGRNLQRLRC